MLRCCAAALPLLLLLELELTTAASSTAAKSYAAQLGQLRYLNRGAVTSADRYELHAVRTIYNEDYSYLGTGTQPDAGYHIGGTQPYLYKVNATANPSGPPAGYKKNFYPVNATLCSKCDIGGGDIPGAETTAASFDACAALCGANTNCKAWVWNEATKNCYPKSHVGASGPNLPDFSGCSPSYPPADCKIEPAKTLRCCWVRF